MSYENSRSVNLDELSAGHLVDALDRSVRSLTSIDSTGEYGGILTRDNVANPQSFDEVGQYVPGIDTVQDINIQETVASKHVAANKGRGDERPQMYHAVVEYGDRYRSATGEHSLSTLARIALATVSLAAQGEGAEIRTIAVTEGQKPHVIEGEVMNPTWTVKRYDNYVGKLNKAPIKGRGEALSRGLESLRLEDTLQTSTDVCVVVSDFLSGARYDKAGKLAGFNWHHPLQYLQHELGDRLLVMRLTTPSQQAIPYARTLLHDGRFLKMDIGDYMKSNERYMRLTAEKAARVSSILGRMRLLEVEATDKAPLVTVPKFIFGLPANLDS